MAQYFIVPDPADLGNNVDFITEVDSIDVIVRQEAGGTYYFGVSTLSNFDEAIGYINTIPSVTNAEIRLEIYLEDNVNTQSVFRNNESGYSSGDMILTGVRTRSNNGSRIDRIVSGSSTKEGQNSRRPDVGTPHIQLSRVNGSDRKTKWWYSTDPEPTDWDLETSSALVSASGRVGMMAEFTTEYRVYSIGVGTDGDAAPSSAPATGPDTPINPSVTNLLATSARLNWEQG